jgi:hypothetical protein
MWSFTKLFGGPAPSRRQARSTVVGDPELFERRRLLSVAMPAAEIGAIVPPHALGESMVGIPTAPGGAAAAGVASTNPAVVTNLAPMAATFAPADQTTDSGQDGGDIPPVLGTVSW